jgi:lysine 2,3-aminomutase
MDAALQDPMTLRKTLKSSKALAEAGLIEADLVAPLERAVSRWPLAVTPAIADLIDRSDAADPIARQFIPSPDELAILADEMADPIGDARFSPVPGVVHRYPDRVLLTPTHACAVYCRFCFRREVVGPGNGVTLSPDALDAALAYVAAHAEIWEVILTGGDPLTLSPRRLGGIVGRLAAIAHVKVLRLHTRLPVAAPERVTSALVRAMKSPRQATYVALHANHPRELTPAVRAACQRIIAAGMPMLGQTVLLGGVNDDAETLGALMRAFVETGIKPYYLHHPDLAPGTSRFRVSLAKGQALMRALRGRISGLCQPTYVLDIPGGYGKVPVGPGYLIGDLAGCATVIDPWGDTHAYPSPGSPPRKPRATT